MLETSLASSSANVLAGNSAKDLCSARRAVRLNMRCSTPWPLPVFDACCTTECGTERTEIRYWHENKLELVAVR